MKQLLLLLDYFQGRRIIIHGPMEGNGVIFFAETYNCRRMATSSCRTIVLTTVKVVVAAAAAGTTSGEAKRSNHQDSFMTRQCCRCDIKIYGQPMKDTSRQDKQMPNGVVQIVVPPEKGNSRRISDPA